MNGNYLTQDDLRRKLDLEKKIDAIRAEVISYNEKKIRDIKLLQSEIKQLDCSKKRSLGEEAEDFSSKRMCVIKTEIIEHETPLPLSSFLTQDDHVKVFIAGSEGNGSGGFTAGFGIWWNFHHKLNLSQRCKGLKQTGKVGEVEAIIKAVQLAKQNCIEKLEVNTSSTYTIKSVQQIPTWRENGWMSTNGKMVINKEYLEDLDELLTSGAGIQVKWNVVNGFDLRIRGNQEAKKLSKKAVKK